MEEKGRFFAVYPETLSVTVEAGKQEVVSLGVPEGYLFKPYYIFFAGTFTDISVKLLNFKGVYPHNLMRVNDDFDGKSFRIDWADIRGDSSSSIAITNNGTSSATVIVKLFGVLEYKK